MNLKNKKLLFFGSAILITVLYFALRLFHLTSLPLFTDEAIYIRWSQIAAQDANWRFISLTDGKQPMYVWIAMLLLKIFNDPLFAGRLVSVIAGFGTVIGLFFLGNELFREKKEKIFSFTQKTVTIGLLSSLFYVIYPFGLVYDRMGLYDSLVGMFAVWALYLLVLLVRTLRLDVALLAGLVIGGGVLTKTNAFSSIYSMPLLLLIFGWGGKGLKNRLIKFFLLCLVVVVLSNVIYSVLRLSPFFHIIAQKNALFFYPIGEWIKHPFTYLFSNLSALVNWLMIYFSVPLLLVIGSFFINKKDFFIKAMLVLWFLAPFSFLAFFGNTIYPRFILFMTLPLIPLVAYSIVELFARYKSNIVRGLILIIAFGFYIYSDFFILTNFAVAPIPRADRIQYMNSWSAGNGLAESVEFFKEQSKDKKIYIVTQGTFGLMPFGLEMYLVDNPNIKINALWPVNNTPPDEITEMAKKLPTYAIFYQPCSSCGISAGKLPQGWNGKLINTYRQGISEDYYSIYQILP